MPLTAGLGTGGSRPGVCTSTTRPASPFEGQIIYETDTDVFRVYNGSGWTSLSPVNTNRNKIINGAFDVWQRGTSFTTDAGATNIYTADRWAARALFPGFGAVQTITRESTHVPTGFVYSLKSVVATAVPENSLRMQLSYTMENIDIMKYAGKTMTVSCQVKSIGNINRLYVSPSYNTSGGRSHDGTVISTQTFTVNTSSFTTCSFSFTVPNVATLTSTGTLGLVFTYGRASGMEQVGDGIYLGAVQMEEGLEATPFEVEDISTTIGKCQRYYQKSFSIGTTPTQNSGVGTFRFSPHGGGFGTQYTIPLRTSMRAAPNITGFNPSNTNGLGRNFSANGDISGISIYAQTTESFTVMFFGTNHDSAGGFQCGWNWAAEIEL